MAVQRLRARWVVPVASPPIENGCVVVEQGRITDVRGSGAGDAGAVDLGDAVLLPGFINAHTHLELTACHRSVPYRGSFVRWIEDLAARRFGMEGPGAQRQSVRDGVRQSLAAGVTAVGDIGHGEDVVDEWRGAALRGVGFLEVLGMGPRRSEPHQRSLAAAEALCRRWMVPPAGKMSAAGEIRRGEPALPDGGLDIPAGGQDVRPAGGRGLGPGLGPHAPYSTDPAVYRRAVEFASRHGVPITTHLAETREEWQFLADGTGPFRDLLEKLGLWDGSFEPPGCSPVAYAERLGLLDCEPLLAHVNYVTDDDLDVLARRPCSVVYCPRAHRFFDHEPHRYRDMLDRGIHICAGTDSLAGNDTLSVLDELRFIRANDPGLSDEQILAMGTTAPARALRLEAGVGSLVAGHRADLVAIPLDNPGIRNPLEDLVGGTARPSAVFLDGGRVG